MKPSRTRGTILLETASVLANEAHEGAQYILRLASPEVAASARPGQFIHIRCDPSLPMRRPMSIMRTNRQAGWIEVLYKALGAGTRLLARRRPGDTLSVLGPIGVPFRERDDRRRPLLLGGGVGIPPMVFLAEHMRRFRASVSPLVLMGSEVPFPFAARPSTIAVQGMPPGILATMPLLEDLGIPCRLASRQGFSGCFEGLVTELARIWLEALPGRERAEVEMMGCGPEPMLRAVAELAREYGLPCQLSLEEYMACAVGGCAGCAVRVRAPSGWTMQRVCVDGPVFDAAAVYPA